MIFKNKKKIKPIKSQKEADRVREYIIVTTMEVKKIGREQAAKRVDALRRSNALDGLHPDDVMFQMIVDEAMSTPQP